jgi:glucose/arabinose dehydrogenase
MLRKTSVVIAALLVLSLAPAPAQAREQCFSETDMCVADAFLTFWERNGGLPVFGLPLGDRRAERSPEGQFDTQWFERERFEAHPEQRAPYNVQLGHLGDELLRRHGRDWQTFPKGQPREGCQFFEQTGHTLCEPFLSYWHSHGLEFDGRRGTSAAESLALFGMPLSEPDMETNSSGDTVLTQWFERARFEHHPANPPAYQVLLGRLGAELFDLAPAGGEVQYAAFQAPGWPHALEVPAGFTIEEVASGLSRPRFMALDPANGSLLVAEAGAGRVTRLFSTGSSGRYNVSQVVADGFEQMHSVAFAHVGEAWQLLVADERRLVRLANFDEGGRARDVTTLLELPGGSRDLYGHRTRTVAQGPDGKLYLSVGSSCDVCVEDDQQRATILRLDPDGGQVEIYASGLRNTVGFDWRSDGTLWGADMGRNNLGGQAPPDELNRLERGQNYGWPYCYGNRVPNPEFNDAARCAASTPPAFDFPAHWAPLGLIFYQQLGFPPSYQGDALVAFHGTAVDQVQDLSGYRVSRVRFRAGQPVALEDLVRGWLAGGQAWGRPVGLLVLPDGSLLISDDLSGRIYRLRYVGM